MRVLHAADFGGVVAGGFVPMIAALARALAARGDELALAVPHVEGASWHAQAREAGAELHAVAGAAQAARFARAWRPDVAHVHFFGWEVGITLPLWASRTRIFWHAHSTSAPKPFPASLRDAAKYGLAARRAERLVVVSDAVGAELVARGAARDRLVTVPNAVDGARFRFPAADERDAARRALGIAPGERAVLFFGRDPALKGADVLAAALPALGAAPTVVTVATPPAARAALAPHARVVALERADDVVPLLWACDALAMPSRGEGFGLVLVEAALAGLPVAASDLPALREAAAGRPRVVFSPPGDAAALGAALEAGLRTPHGIAGDPAPDRAENAPETWARRVLALYDAPRR